MASREYRQKQSSRHSRCVTTCEMTAHLLAIHTAGCVMINHNLSMHTAA